MDEIFYYLPEHKELHKKIWDCKNPKCKPSLRGGTYCEDCIKLVVDFCNKYGIGVLTQDIRIEDLTKEVSGLKTKNSGLKLNIHTKVKRIEELKKEVNDLKLQLE